MDTRQRDCPAEEYWKEMVPSAAISRHRLPAFWLSDCRQKFPTPTSGSTYGSGKTVPGESPIGPFTPMKSRCRAWWFGANWKISPWPEPKFGFGEPLYLASSTETTSVLTKSDLRLLRKAARGCRDNSCRHSIRGCERIISRHQHFGRCRMRHALHVSCGGEWYRHRARRRRSSAAN